MPADEPAPQTHRWSGPAETAASTNRFTAKAAAAAPIPVRTPLPAELAPHHLATLAEFRRRGDDVDRWKLRSVIDIAIGEDGITSRWTFVRPPATTPVVMDVVVSNGRVARITAR